jgi:archaellum biogenesis ATPase FlaH
VSERRRPISAAELLQKEIPPASNWIEGGILPKGGLLLMGGGPKIGKSLVALEYSRALMTKTPLFGKSEFAVSAPARILYYEQEVGEFGVRNRIRSAFHGISEGILEDRFFVLSKEPEIQLDTQEGLNYIAEDVDKICPNVVIFDPIDSLHSGNDNDKQHVQNILRTTELLRDQFKELDLSVILLHHFKKPPDEKFQQGYDHLSPYNFTGSQRWFGAPDTLNTFHRTCKQINGIPHESWYLNTRFTLRQDGAPPDMRLIVNKENDLRVKFNKTIGMPPALKLEGKLGKQPEPEQEELELV